MKKTFVAQKLIKRLNQKIQRQLDLRDTLILGVVLKGLPVAYSLARMNSVVANFVPVVAQRRMHMQHQVESYFPSLEWIAYFKKLADTTSCTLIVDDVVNAGFTRQKVEGVVLHLMQALDRTLPLRFAALVLNRKRLANPSFAQSSDIFALEVNASDVECDWGLMTVPLWSLPVKEALERCEEYYKEFWLNEKRCITISY